MAGEDGGGEGHEFRELDGTAGFRAGALCGHKFESTHPTAIGVTEALHGIEALGGAALAGQPGMDQAVAEAVGQGIGEKAGSY